MKLYPVFATAVLAIVSTAALPAASFEGTVRMKMSQPRGEAFEMTYRVKEGFIRTEVPAGEGVVATIMDLNKQEMIVLMPEQQMYMVHSLAAAKAAAEKATQGSDVTFEKTDDTEKILGYDCVKYISKSKDQISDVWVTEELGGFAGLGSAAAGGKGRGKAQAAWEKALMGKDVFPLRVVSRSPKGAEQFRLEVVAVDKAAQPDSLFAPPAGYQKFDMGGMMRGLLPGAKR